jgi:hypothetical protein
MAGITITTQDDLPGADGDQPYTLFVNQTEYGVVLVFMEALELDPPLTLVCNHLHLQLEGYPIEQGVEIEMLSLLSTISAETHRRVLIFGDGSANFIPLHTTNMSTGTTKTFQA